MKKIVFVFVTLFLIFGCKNTTEKKIDKKIKSGDLKESELIEEAAMMFQKIKGMPGMSQFESMFQGPRFHYQTVCILVASSILDSG
jgi:hypothetical protein